MDCVQRNLTCLDSILWCSRYHYKRVPCCQWCFAQNGCKSTFLFNCRLHLNGFASNKGCIKIMPKRSAIDLYSKLQPSQECELSQATFRYLASYSLNMFQKKQDCICWFSHPISVYSVKYCNMSLCNFYKVFRKTLPCVFMAHALVMSPQTSLFIPDEATDLPDVIKDC